MSITRVLRALASIAVLLASVFTADTAFAATRLDSLGKEFWLAFPSNYNQEPTLTLFVSGATATQGTVTIPGLSFSQTFSVTPGAVTSIDLPANAQANQYGVVENLGIHVVADDEVSIYGLNRIVATTDAYLGLPVDVLGTEYRALGYTQTSFPSEYLVVATRNGTSVTAPAFKDCPAVNLTLDAGQTYQVACADVSGAPISASAPIAVFAGAKCTNIPPGAFYCDHVVEQMPALSAWGKQFLTVPLATRTRGDTFRVLAQADGTAVSINGAAVATLAAGEFYEAVLTGQNLIIASAPVLVAQYSNGTTYDGVVSDPFEMLVPPYEQYLNNYTVTTPASGFSQNFINVIIPTSSIGNLIVDGAPALPSAFTPIGSTGFSGAQLAVSLGSHTLAARLPFGVFVYGFDNADSYGYPGGLSLSPIAVVTSLRLAPPTATHGLGEQACVTATVADQNAQPVASIRVDFAVTGANPGSGFGISAADGTAGYCYVGSNGGNDTVTATVGTLSATATVIWQQRQTQVTIIPTTLINLSPPSLTVNVTAKAKLQALNPLAPLAGQTVSFTTKAGSLLNGGQPLPICTAKTDSNGIATCTGVLLRTRLGALLSGDLGLHIVGSFAGAPGFQGSSGDGIVIKLLGGS